MKQIDLEEVATLEKSIFSNPWSKESFCQVYNQEDKIYLVAIDKDKMVGYIGLWISFEVADLCNLAVAPDYRKNGIGEELLNQGIALCKEQQVEQILLEVRQSNYPARELYEKNGFQIIGKRHSYYKNPEEDGILMALTIITSSK